MNALRSILFVCAGTSPRFVDKYLWDNALSAISIASNADVKSKLAAICLASALGALLPPLLNSGCSVTAV
jgi:hypothetical protein